MNTIKTYFDAFLQTGLEVDGQEWELIHEERVTNKPNLTKLAKVPQSNRNMPSIQDTELFLVRYKYSGSASPQRDFCVKMMATNRVFRYEDILFASSQPVNPGWGPNGTDTYDLWLYKGGGNCYHFWMRQIYLRKNNKKLSANEARRMINALSPEERQAAKWVENDPLVARLPIDQPNRAFLPK